MKIASKKPPVLKQPVYVTKDRLELWYSKPISLGEIFKDGLYWFTQDGMRFASSRDALEYRIKVYEAAASGREPSVATKEELAKSVHSGRRRKRSIVQPAVVDNQTLFQQFMEFVKHAPREGAQK